VARAHHFGDLLEDKDELMLLPFTQTLKTMQEVLL